MELIQSNPIPIYNLDLNAFRMALKGLEDSPEGMPFLKTHNHDTESTMGGVTYARKILILSPYTVTFEDDQYAVNLIGANSNVGDLVNVNQVSVRSANSAGLITSVGIESIEYKGGVTIDVVNGFPGTIPPIGTPRRPSNNVPDALLIASVKGFNRFYIVGDITYSAGHNIEGMISEGQTQSKTLITVEPEALTEGSEFFQATVVGEFDGVVGFVSCGLRNIQFVEADIDNCTLLDDIVLTGNGMTSIINSRSGMPGGQTPYIDMGGSGRDLNIKNYSGALGIRNKTGTDTISIDMSSGRIVIDNTVTNGEITVRGTATLVDNSNGDAVVNKGALINVETVTRATWRIIYFDSINGESGTEFPIGTVNRPVNNFTDLMSISNETKLKNIDVSGTLVLGASVNGYIIESNSVDTGIVDLNGQETTNTLFITLNIIGNGTGHFDANGCRILNGLTSINGHFENCILGGTFTVPAGETLNADRCSAMASCIINLNGTGSVGIANFSGIITFINATDAGCTIGLTGNYLSTIHSSCTAGQAYISGIGICNNLSTMSILDKTLPFAVLEEQIGSHTASGTLAEAIKIAMGLGHNNFKLVGSAWDSNGNITSGLIYIYTNNTMDNILKTYAVTSSFSGLNLTEYISLEL